MVSTAGPAAQTLRWLRPVLLSESKAQSWHAKLLFSKEKKALANDCIKRTVILNLKKNAEQRPLGCKKRGPHIDGKRDVEKIYKVVVESFNNYEETKLEKSN